MPTTGDPSGQDISLPAKVDCGVGWRGKDRLRTRSGQHHQTGQTYRWRQKSIALRRLDSDLENLEHVANAILQKNADELVKLVETLFNQSPPAKKVGVVFMGGLLTEENEYSTIVKQKVVAALPNVLVMKPKFPAAFGAAIMGLNAF